MKALLATVGAVMTAVTLGAAEAESENSELEKEETQLLEAGFDFDFMSAYVWRNAVQNDEMVMQPCVWADFTYFEPFYLGFTVWENFDLTDRRHDTGYEKGVTETDYNVHIGSTVWENDDDMSLGLELGHEWFDNHFVRDGNSIPDSRELYLKATFDNPFINVYGQVSWMYEDFGDYKQGVHYEIGFNREYEIIDSVTVGADWNVNFGTGHYLNYLYGGTRSDDGEYTGSSAGFGGTTIKAYLTWQVTEWFSLGGVVAYTGVLNGAYRESLGDTGDDYWDGGGFYQRDFVWGGLQAKLSF